jgi:Winged helix-turn-helix DNA-binding
MQFERRFAEGIRAGDITVSFRRWSRPQVVAGRRYRLPFGGFFDVTRIDRIDKDTIRSADARRAGFTTLAELIEYLGAKRDAAGSLFRVQLRYCGDATPDPRAQLAQRVADDAETEALRERLDAMDRRSSQGPWTREILELIAASPATRAADLAKRIGWDVPTFKGHVRKLKELGLTESLEVGYRLSPRGGQFLRARH